MALFASEGHKLHGMRTKEMRASYEHLRPVVSKNNPKIVGFLYLYVCVL